MNKCDNRLSDKNEENYERMESIRFKNWIMAENMSKLPQSGLC